jgi:hypothetical protein
MATRGVAVDSGPLSSDTATGVLPSQAVIDARKPTGVKIEIAPVGPAAKLAAAAAAKG